MSHTFDSGLANAMRTLLVDAMIQKLTPLLSPGLGGQPDGFLEGIVTIPFSIDSKHDVHEIDLLWAVIGPRAPIVAIFPGTLRPQRAGGVGTSQGDLAVELYIVSTHRRDLTDGRATMDAIATGDDTADPGIFATVELVWARLFDGDLGLGSKFGVLKLEHEGQLHTDLQRTIWKQEYRIAIQRDANMYRGLTQKLTNMKATLKQSAPNTEPAGLQIKVDTVVG